MNARSDVVIESVWLAGWLSDPWMLEEVVNACDICTKFKVRIIFIAETVTVELLCIHLS